MRTIRWGILGTGFIAGTFAQGLKAVEGAELAAVASRSAPKAEEFARRFGARRACGIYDALYEDPQVDAVYVATPHSEHCEEVLRCIRAGKAVLCEKPLAPTAAQAQEMIAAARGAGVFLMEAMWTRFLPAVRRAARWVEEGRIGEPLQLSASFCVRAEFDPHSRLFDPALAGGALLDVGVYPLHLAALFFGARPEHAAGVAALGPTGVDVQGAAALSYPSGALAALRFALRAAAGEDAVLTGAEGELRLPFFYRAEHAELWKDGALLTRFDTPFDKNGYEYEARHVGDCLRQGLLESPLMPLADTLDILRTADALRAGWGQRYPFE